MSFHNIVMRPADPSGRPSSYVRITTWRVPALTLLFNFTQVVQIVCCNLSSLQSDLYNTICQSKEVKALLKSGGGGGCTVLSSITALKKLCNHPKVGRARTSLRTNTKRCVQQRDRQLDLLTHVHHLKLKLIVFKHIGLG